MALAFVTGGSGFIGGRLIERLRAEGLEVRGLARSDASAEAVAARGAEPVRGDLNDVRAMREGAQGADFFFHAAAKVEDWGPREDFERINVQGTRDALDAAADSGVRRFVHVGTEAALLAGQPLENANELTPLRPDSPALYSATKAKAEQAVRDADRESFETVVIRPRFVWGKGDTSLLPTMVEIVESGRWRWIGGGRHRTSTTHVDNTVEGLWLGATRGRPGSVYFVTDGEPVVFRDFVTRLLRTQGAEPPDKDLPLGVAKTAAAVAERVTRKGRRPPLTRFAVWASALECTIDISRARSELRYEPVRSIDDGLAELEAAARAGG
jgi:nucleoside-diphosphate-sugar epimerase